MQNLIKSTKHFFLLASYLIQTSATPTTAAYTQPFSLASGAQYGCAVVSNGGAPGACITDGGGNYANGETCVFTVARSVQLVVMSFDTERYFDTLTVDGIRYSGTMADVSSGIDGTSVTVGSQITWTSDTSNVGAGFVVCGVASGTGFLLPTAPTPLQPTALPTSPTTAPTTAPTSLPTSSSPTSPTTPRPTLSPTSPTAAPSTTSPTSAAPTVWVSPFVLASGAQYGCAVVGNGGAPGSCITDGPGNYANDERCNFTVVRTVQLVVVSFDTEAGFDALTVNSHAYSGTMMYVSSSLNGVQVTAGSQITWISDYVNLGNILHSGYMVCAVASGTGFSLPPSPSTSPTPFGYVQPFSVSSGTQYGCAIVSNDRVPGASCITDGPSDYLNNERCTFAVGRAMRLVVVSFDTEAGFDVLTVDGVQYSGEQVGGTDEYSNDGGGPVLDGVTLAAGSQITWESDYSGVGAGFIVCGVDLPSVSPTPAEYVQLFSLSAGAQYGCAVVDPTNGGEPGSCITDGPGNYANSQRCTFTVGRSAQLVVVSFDTERYADELLINGRYYSGTIAQVRSSLDGVQVTAGSQITWMPDPYSYNNGRYAGFVVCAVASETVSPTAPTTAAPSTPPTAPTASFSPTEAPTSDGTMCRWSGPLPGCIVSTAYEGPFSTLASAKNACELHPNCTAAYGVEGGGMTSSVVNGSTVYSIPIGTGVRLFQPHLSMCPSNVSNVYLCREIYNAPCSNGSCISGFVCGTASSTTPSCDTVCNSCVPGASAITDGWCSGLCQPQQTSYCRCMQTVNGYTVLAPPTTNASCFSFSAGIYGMQGSDNIFDPFASHSRVRSYPPVLGDIVCPAVVNATNWLNTDLGPYATRAVFNVAVNTTSFLVSVTRVWDADRSWTWGFPLRFTCCMTGARTFAPTMIITAAPTASTASPTMPHPTATPTTSPTSDPTSASPTPSEYVQPFALVAAGMS